MFDIVSENFHVKFERQVSHHVTNGNGIRPGILPPPNVKLQMAACHACRHVETEIKTRKNPTN